MNESNTPFSSVKYPMDIVEKNEKKLVTEEEQIQRTGQVSEIPQFVSEKISNDTEEKEEDIKKQEGSFYSDDEIYFIDIQRGTSLVHIYGPPSSGKTTFTIQAAVEIFPQKSYFLITSHSTSFLKRMKLIIADNRWKEFKELNKYLYPISVSNLTELENHIERFKMINPEEIGLIIIDHITDYVRGEIHKEEMRIRLRNILETLYLLADEKQCKVFIVNGFSYKDAAPAEDIIESFCDMTVLLENDGKDTNLVIEEEKIKIYFDNSGIKNIHLNIYF